MGDKIKKVKGKRFSIFLLVALLLILYWNWFLPGLRVANDFPIVSDSQAKSFMDLPRLWTERGAVGLGEYTIFTTWSYPVSFISGMLANLGVSFIVLERIFLILTLLIGSIGIWQIVGYFNFGYFAKIVSSILYLTNTYILLLIDGGQLSIALAYGWFPICFLLLEQAIDGNLRRQLFAGLAISVLGFFDVRFIYLLLLLALIRFLYELVYLSYKKWGIWILNWVKLGVVSGLVVLGLHAFWLLPLYKAPLSDTTFAQLVQATSTNFISLGHSILLLNPHWFKNVFGQISPLRFEFILIPILVFLAPILKPKDKIVGFWLLVVLISVFLAKGVSEPFANLYSWLFLNVPGFSLFRDSSKFFFLVSLSYSLLIGLTVSEIIKRFKKFPKLGVIFLIILILYLLFLIRPIWSDGMTGTFAHQPFQKEYEKFASILEDDLAFNRTFWIPFTQPLTYSNHNHPIVEAARLVQIRPFNTGTKGTYELFNFLREAPYMGEIFDIAGIGYIVYPYLDVRRDNLHPDNIKYYYTFSDQLSNLPWLSKISDSPIPLWKVKQHQDRFFLTPNVWMVIGSDSIYSKTTNNNQLRLSQNALIFVEEYPGLGSRIDELPEAKIVLNNKTITDLAASFIEPNNLIFPSRQLEFDPDQSGWWKREASDLIRWRDFLQTKYGLDNLDFDLGGGWAVGEGNLRLEVGSEKWEVRSGNILLARVMESSKSGSLKFYQNNQLVGEVVTKTDTDANVRWFEVGQLIKDGQLTIESAGDINVVNALAILNNDEWIGLQSKANINQNKIVNFDEKNIQQASASVTYQQINPTKYLIKIRNLDKPGFLIFSESYDDHWRLNGQQPFPVYSLLNGFNITRDGDYVVEFETQKYVYPGLVISLSTLALIMYLLLIHKHKQSRI